MPDESDVALAVALAEYEHLREARKANTEQSTARFNFFLVVASAATATAGGLLTGGGSGAANTGAVVGMGALVLLLGLTVFVRQVEFTNRARLYAVGIDSVRTYLTRRAPEVAPYLIMPTLDAPGVYQGRPPGGPWLRDAIGLSGTIGLVNSALLAVGSGITAGRLGAATWLAATTGLAVMVMAGIAHVWYIRRRTVTAFGRIRTTVEQRHPPAGTPPQTRCVGGSADAPERAETPRVHWAP